VAGARRLWSVPLAAVIVAALVLDVWHRPWATGEDFHTYEAAALVGLQQGWSDIYDQGLINLAQIRLAPWLWTQPFLSPPPVAWMAAMVASLPYGSALVVWQSITLATLAAALAWSSNYRGAARAIAVGAALAPWWVFHAVYVGQVVPVIAAGVVVAWRLAREKHDVAAGMVLCVVLLKPNTALLAPIAVLAAGRFRLFGSWLLSAGFVVAASLLMIGPHGASFYLADLGHLPPNASALTLSGTFGADGGAAMAIRLVIVGAALVSAYRLRTSAGLALAMGVLASMTTAPYLHDNDLCMLVAAGWIVWSERSQPAWRALLAAIWLLGTPILEMSGFGPPLTRWLLLELAIMVALAIDAWVGTRELTPPLRPLTNAADFGRPAPA
jgi:alpha-1,2-mannosyltransferase